MKNKNNLVWVYGLKRNATKDSFFKIKKRYVLLGESVINMSCKNFFTFKPNTKLCKNLHYQTLKEHSSYVNDIKYFTDGRTIVSCSSEDTKVERYYNYLKYTDISNGNHKFCFENTNLYIIKLINVYKFFMTHFNFKLNQ
ncbi:hypothetical protein RFI_01590 [Reticulomyxa filosa]|uniref:Uncharacterized protein n=1 Tax=Reticulomyxa filosa TaxID=46433 RepID=X6PBC9_RETFI|nr:hypothetical protein RFI_01590 [Reticulomyxa filosa]|eukprot:ETO35471.1 hypothetical protein RFI_01590 [Reticulomyxa filosa]